MILDVYKYQIKYFKYIHAEEFLNTITVNSTNTTKHKSLVSRGNRENLHKHKGIVIWFTGLSASGKSTIAHLVEKSLHCMGCSTYVFDGDNVRHGLCGDLGFSNDDRAENVRRIGEMVNLFIDAGIIAVTAFISPVKKEREKVRDLVGSENFIEVYIDCPIDVCIERDPKGIYKKALTGEIEEFTGVSSPYEVPDTPDIRIESDKEEFNDAAQRVVDFLVTRSVIINNDTR